MKSILTLIVTCLFIGFLNTDTTVQGTITDATTGDKVFAATVQFFQAGELIAGTTTNSDGFFRLFIEPGTYDIQVDYTGYPTKMLYNVVVKSETINTVDVQLNADSSLEDLSLDEVVVTEYKVPVVEMDKTTSGAVITGEDVRKFATKEISSVAATTSGTTTAKDAGAVTVRGTRSGATDVYVDGIRTPVEATKSKSSPRSTPPAVREEAAEPLPEITLSYDTETYEEKIESRPYSDEDAVLKEIEKSGGIKLELTEESTAAKTITEPPIKVEKAGQLTAGEWRDLDNWTFWNNLMGDPTFSKMRTHWDFHPNHRYSVFFNDQEERPIADLRVSLVNSEGVTVWEGRTDNSGKAELWGNFYGGSERHFELIATHEGQQYTFQPASFEQNQNLFKLPVDCKPRDQVDLAFVVDATGSMSDEINYLKAEMSDVIQRVKEDNATLKINTASVFYRDEGDDYVTQSSPFTPNTRTTSGFIQMQSAAGGGDYPEAVHTALEVAIDSLAWSDDALSRILFLVLDAPAHNNPKVLTSLHQSVKKAAAKGIKIIPITASGINKKTEFLMKFFAMGTNGTYVFITNHSGIGNHHIEATAESYNVEPLNDLMVRLILENTEYETCEQVDKLTAKQIQKHIKSETKNGQKVKGLDFKISYFPNPAENRFFLNLEKAVDLLIISSTNGHEVKRLGPLTSGRTGVDLSTFVAGYLCVAVC